MSENEIKRANRFLPEEEEKEIDVDVEEVEGEEETENGGVVITIDNHKINYEWPDGSKGNKPGSGFDVLKDVIDDTAKYNSRIPKYTIVDKR